MLHNIPNFQGIIIVNLELLERSNLSSVASPTLASNSIAHLHFITYTGRLLPNEHFLVPKIWLYWVLIFFWILHFLLHVFVCHEPNHAIIYVHSFVMCNCINIEYIGNHKCGLFPCYASCTKFRLWEEKEEKEQAGNASVINNSVMTNIIQPAHRAAKKNGDWWPGS